MDRERTAGGTTTASADGASLDGATADGGAVDAADACDYRDAIDGPCSTDADCTYIVHRTDCCGSIRFWGVPTSQADEVVRLEVACDRSLPECTCPASAATDSGETGGRRSMLASGCVPVEGAMRCRTHVNTRP